MVATQTSSCRIFVVDDDHAQRRLLQILLDADPDFAHVGEAIDGADCLEQLSSLSAEDFPDVVILDLDMPRMAGCAAALELRTRWPQTNVVIYTSYDRDMARKRVGLDGIRYVEKGSPDHLLTNLRSCCQAT